MNNELKRVDWKAALPRMLLDFLLIHASMLFSLSAVHLFYYTRTTNAQEIADALRHYYLSNFLPASPLFLLVLLLNGVYGAARTYSAKMKLRLLAQSVGVAVLLIMASNYFLFREQIVARSVTALFTICAFITLVGGRFLRLLEPKKEETKLPPGPGERAPVLVVGGAGYIGSLICQKLLDSGQNVRVLDSLVYGDGAIRHLHDHPSFELIVGDCRNIQSVVGAVKGVRAIIHLAAIVGDPACEQDRKSALEINYAATRMLVEIAKGNGVGRFVFASSCSVYGATDVVMDESSIVRPVSIYGETKVDSERAILEAVSDDFHPTILRLATVFGLGFRPRFDLVVNLLTARAVTEGVMTIFNGEQWRPFIHVRDVAEGFIRVLNAPIPVVTGQIYNLGDSNQNYTLTGVAEEIHKMCPNSQVQHITNSDPRNYRVSFSKIRRDLGFTCSVGLQDGIQELKQAFEQGRIVDYKDQWYHNQKTIESLVSLASINEMDSQVMAAFSPRKPREKEKAHQGV
jgi:nucleoside-diphosphate-sugar epimerase